MPDGEKVKEKEVFLNGEVSVAVRKGQKFGDAGKNVKKTNLCLKGLKVNTMRGVRVACHTRRNFRKIIAG